MKRALLILLIPVMGHGQDLATLGARTYAKTCGTGYCHAADGAAGGGAPRLAARGLSDEYITRTVKQGIAGTGMPAFEAVLTSQELQAVVAYVSGLNATSPSPATTPEVQPEKRMPPQAAKGRTLFYDAVRGFGRCATCHEVAGLGIPVASPIAHLPLDAAALRQLITPQIQTAIVAGDRFPAKVVSEAGQRIQLYDLSLPPPVLRTFAREAVALRRESAWRHSDVLLAYTDSELQRILAYLRIILAPNPCQAQVNSTRCY